MKRLIKISEHDIPNRDFAFLYINGKFFDKCSSVWIFCD